MLRRRGADSPRRRERKDERGHRFRRFQRRGKAKRVATYGQEHVTYCFCISTYLSARVKSMGGLINGTALFSVSVFVG